MNPNPPSSSLSGHIIIGDHSFTFVHVSLKPLCPCSFLFLFFPLDKLTLLSTHAHSNVSLHPLSVCLSFHFSLSTLINMGEQTPPLLCSFPLFGQINFGESVRYSYKLVSALFCLHWLRIFLSLGQISTGETPIDAFLSLQTN